MTAPGVYIQSKQSVVEQGRIRTDVGALLGYAERGPVNVAVPVNSVAQFNQVFGAKRLAYLADAVAGFFVNGGKDLFVVRVAGTNEHTSQLDNKRIATASVELPDACYQCYAAAPAYIGPGNDTQTQALAKFDNAELVGTERFNRLKSPGSWGNDLQLSLTLDNASQMTVEQWHDYAQVMRLSSVANLEVGSVLDISALLADAEDGNHWCTVIAVDIARREVTLSPDTSTRIDQQKAQQSLSVYSTLLQMQLYYRKYLVEQWPKLGLHVSHSRYFVDVINQASLYIAFEPKALSDSWLWLAEIETSYQFEGGIHQLGNINESDFSVAIEQLALEPQIALVAAPDIVFRQLIPQQQLPKVHAMDCCSFPRFEAKGHLRAKIITKVVGETATRLVTSARAVITTTSIEGFGPLIFERFADPHGVIELEDIPVGIVTLTIEANGFEQEDFTTTIAAGPFVTNAEFSLTAIELLPSFSEAQILSLQQLLVTQAEQLRQYYLLLDVPVTTNKLQQVIDWRYQFDSRLTSLLYPWLTFDDLAQDRELPPSALVMGALAKTDKQRGINYASANLPIDTLGQLQHQLTVDEHKTLNDAHVNCLLVKPGENIHLMGARTLSFARDYQYITTSRLILYVVQYLHQRMQWAAFEPNSVLLRIAIVAKLNGLLQQLWRKGALRGASSKEAFSLVCDDSNNTASSVDAGRLIADIGLAIVEPAEFIWLSYQRQNEQSDVRVAG